MPMSMQWPGFSEVYSVLAPALVSSVLLAYPLPCTDNAYVELFWIVMVYASGKCALLLAEQAGFQQMHLKACRVYTLAAFCSVVWFSTGFHASWRVAIILYTIPVKWLWWGAAGIVFMCRDPDNGKAYILVGQESMRGHPWCFPYGGSERKDRGDPHKTAAREAAEETSYALGFPDDIYNKYFRGKTPRQFGGAYLVDLGYMSEAERQNVVRQHLRNRNENGLGRRLHGCEREMIRLKWCDGVTFLKHAGGSIPGFGHFRGFCAHIMSRMAKSTSFSEWAKHSKPRTSVTDPPSHGDTPDQDDARRCPKGHELADYVTRGNICKECRNHFCAGTHVMNCDCCGWWLCERCFKGESRNAVNGGLGGSQLHSAPQPDHRMAESAPGAREMDDEEFEMFVNALGASLSDMPASFQVSDAEAEMIASAIRASESGAVGCLDDDEQFQLACALSLSSNSQSCGLHENDQSKRRRM